MDIPVELSRILITELGEQQVVFLKEVDGDRGFPILIGINEALAIDRRLKGIETPRPMTHDLLAGVIHAMGGKLEKIVINDLREHTFYARLHIRQDGGMLEIDSRPSDAIALGAAMDTPIYVAEGVMETLMEGPASKAERIELLRRRMEMLRERIEQFSDQLDDEEFVNTAPPEVVAEVREQRDQMQQEYDAIDEVLRKLG
ncbi:MAG: bifunctional nuclease family protein [Phycisphaerae bacterium]|nr:bifunctional nuclease family protein [Phycisphaerae bacterium]